MSNGHNISRQDILLDLSSTNKFDCFNEVLDHLEGAGQIDRVLKEWLYKALEDREEQASFATGHHVAIPHINGVNEIEECLFVYGRSVEGIEFGSCDTGLVNHIFLFLIPEKFKCGWLRTLSMLAKSLSQSEVRESLLHASDVDEAFLELNKLFSLE